MNCPKDISEILLDIIRVATRRIRAEAGNGDARRCGIEACHIHNLPHLLKHYRHDMLLYYYEVEIPTYLQESEGINLVDFEPLWSKLGMYIELQKLNQTQSGKS